MKRFVTALVVFLAFGAVVAPGAADTNVAFPQEDNMTDDNMTDDGMSDDNMSDDNMSDDTMSEDNMDEDNMTDDEMAEEDMADSEAESGSQSSLVSPTVAIGVALAGVVGLALVLARRSG